MIKLLVADNHPIVRFGIKNLLRQEEDFRVVGDVPTTKDLFEKIKKNVMDFVADAKDEVVDLGQIGTDKLNIKLLENKIRKFATNLGMYVIDKFQAGSQTINIKDAEISEILDKVSQLEKEIKKYEDDIAEIKSEGQPE